MNPSHMNLIIYSSITLNKTLHDFWRSYGNNFYGVQPKAGHCDALFIKCLYYVFWNNMKNNTRGRKITITKIGMDKQQVGAITQLITPIDYEKVMRHFASIFFNEPCCWLLNFEKYLRNLFQLIKRNYATKQHIPLM